MEDGFKFVGRHAAAGDKGKRANHTANHFVEEARAKEIHADEGTKGDDFSPHNGADRVGEFGILDRERAEIVAALNTMDCVAQGIDIGEVGHVPRITSGKGIFIAGIDNVDVGFALGGETGVKGVGNDFSGANADVGREKAIQGFLELPVRDVRGGRRLKRTNHAKSMNTGIGTAAALNANQFAATEKMKEAFLNDLLNRKSVGLSLPAVICSAVKAEFHFEGGMRQRCRGDVRGENGRGGVLIRQDDGRNVKRASQDEYKKFL